MEIGWRCSIIRPHRSAKHKKRSGLLSPMFRVSVPTVSGAKRIEPIEIPLALWTQMDPRNYVLGRAPHPSEGRGIYDRPLTGITVVPGFCAYNVWKKI